jgi:peptide/nickel transport system substrate-binding protein
MQVKKPFTLVGLLIVFAIILAACQPATIIETVVVTEVVMKEGTPEVVEKVVEVVVTPTPIPPTAMAPTPIPQLSDTVVIGMQQEPDSLHPLFGSMSANAVIRSAFLVGCLGQNEVAEWIPYGCEEVPTLENGGAVFVGEGEDKHMEITYKIRDGWRWTDGTPVTPADVIFFWELIMDPQTEIAQRNLTEKIYEIVAVDDQTFKTVFMSAAQAHLAAAGTLTGLVDFAAFQADYEQSGYANQTGPVVDPVYWNAGYPGWLPVHVLGDIPPAEQPAVDFTQVPGDGAFYVKEWNQGQEIVLERSDLPFPLGDAKVKTIIWRFFGESAGVLSALQNGEIDAVARGGVGGLTVYNSPDLDAIEAAGLYTVSYPRGYAWEHIDLNMTKFPLDDVRVRQALFYAIDRETLVQTLYYGKQGTTDLPVPPGLSWGYTDNYTKYPYDPERARALLAEAGWDCSVYPCVNADGRNLEFTLMTTDRVDRQELAQVIQQMWRALNVGVNLQFLYGRGLFTPCSAGGPLYCRTFDAAIYTYTTGDDPQFMGLYDCASIPSEENNWSGQNDPGFCNPEADEALFMNELDPTVSLSRDLRYPYIEKFFQLWTDAVPVIPLFSNTTVYVNRVGFENFKPGPTTASVDAWNAWEWVLYK